MREREKRSIDAVVGREINIRPYPQQLCSFGAKASGVASGAVSGESGASLAGAARAEAKRRVRRGKVKRMMEGWWGCFGFGGV